MGKKDITSEYSGHNKRNSILKGTMILTLAGFLTRIIGFFYKIFLSNTMGPELLGIYQLVFPVYGICFTIYATGIQTSISRLVSAELGRRNHKNAFRILRIGLIISVSLALLLSVLVYFSSDYIAFRFLLEKRSSSSLKILALVFPFCGVTSCINGYYYGLKRTSVPASTQLLEQIIRVVAVYMVALYMGNGNLAVTCEMAVFGIVIGEIASCIYNVISLFIAKSPEKLIALGPDPTAKAYTKHKITKDLLTLSVPLSANRLFISILHSIEAILIPTMLRRFGLTNADALSAYGILNGMSIPFILFPTALINALAVLLLPTISEAQAVNNEKLIAKTTGVSIKYSLIIGIMSTGIFVIFGNDLGNAVFHNQSAGSYLMILAWLCPFIYLATTLGSVINGLGKAHITFTNSVVGSLSKIFLIIILIPKFGINGYLISLLIGQLIITALDSFAVMRNTHLTFNAVDSLLKPGLITAFLGFLINATYNYTKKMIHINQVIFILSFCLIYSLFNIGFMYVTHTISTKEL